MTGTSARSALLAAFEQPLGVIAALAELGDPQLDGADSRIQAPLAIAIAAVYSVLAPPVACSSQLTGSRLSSTTVSSSVTDLNHILEDGAVVTSSQDLGDRNLVHHCCGH